MLSVLAHMRTKSRRSLLLASVVIVASMLLCIQLLPSSGPGSLIRKPGIYMSPNERWQLDVVINSAIVNYAVIDTASGKVIIQDTSGSRIQRWFFQWGDQELWFHSSDLGSGVWILAPASPPRRVELNDIWPNQELSSKMPHEFFNNLPSTLKRDSGSWQDRKRGRN